MPASTSSPGDPRAPGDDDAPARRLGRHRPAGGRVDVNDVRGGKWPAGSRGGVANEEVERAYFHDSGRMRTRPGSGETRDDVVVAGSRVNWR
jgi:hypothetical protein